MKREGILHGLCIALICSMAMTEGLLILQGRWQEAIPLHLCSISAIAAALLVHFRRQFLLNFLWYLGMPGASLALIFPAPAISICQPQLNLSYFVTHALILLIPVLRIWFGMRPQRGKILQMMLVLSAIAVPAAAANSALGTDFLFLSAPPAGTPLEVAFSMGKVPYWIMLFALMLLCCQIMNIAAEMIENRTA